MKLFWNTFKNKNSFWGKYHYENSSSWISEITQNVNFDIIKDLDQVNDDEIIVVDSNISEKKNFYFELSNKFSKIFLIHLGDEGATEETDLIYNLCTHVWRTFWMPKFLKFSNVTCIPIGYKSGLILKNKKLDTRKYTWSFMGTVHGASRQDMIYQNRIYQKNLIKLTSEFGGKDSFSSNKYYEVLNDSIFAPIPHGYFHPESYRLYEALECGCIPLIENPHNFFDNFLPNNPLIKINLWSESTEIIKEMLSDNKIFSETSNKIRDWWYNYKIKIKNTFKNKINV